MDTLFGQFLSTIPSHILNLPLKQLSEFEKNQQINKNQGISLEKINIKNNTKKVIKITPATEESKKIPPAPPQTPKNQKKLINVVTAQEPPLSTYNLRTRSVAAKKSDKCIIEVFPSSTTRKRKPVAPLSVNKNEETISKRKIPRISTSRRQSDVLHSNVLRLSQASTELSLHQPDKLSGKDKKEVAKLINDVQHKLQEFLIKNGIC